MHCRHCNRNFAQDAVYCSQCGQKLAYSEALNKAEIQVHGHYAITELKSAADEQTAALVAETSALPEVLTRKETAVYEAVPREEYRKSKSRLGIWVTFTLLLTCALATSIGVFTYYQYEMNINNEVLKLQQDARTAALGGHYDEALALLHKASSKRPQFYALQSDEDIVLHAIELEQLIAEAENKLNQESAIEAGKQLDEAQSKLTGRKEPVYSKLRGKLDELTVALKVHRLNNELAYAGTIKQVTEQLHAVNKLAGEGAGELKEKMLSKLIRLSTEEANGYLKKKSYTKALTSVDQALVFAPDDEELLELHELIKKEQQKYEQEEQKRIEQAMQKAAEEDLINQTAAVEVIKIEQTIDEFGNMLIEGSLRNAATRPIHSVVIEFTVYGQNGEKLTSGSETVTPNYIEAGEKMSFTSNIFGVYWQDSKVVIDHASWYLD